MVYLAIDTDTGEVKGFTAWEDLKECARQNEYKYEYYELKNAAPLYRSEILEEEE